jgi:hypothetical protein
VSFVALMRSFERQVGLDDQPSNRSRGGLSPSRGLSAHKRFYFRPSVASDDGHLRRAFLYGGEIEPSAPTEHASLSSPTSLPRRTGPEASRVGHHFRVVAHGAVMGSIAAPAVRPFNGELAGPGVRGGNTARAS